MRLAIPPAYEITRDGRVISHCRRRPRELRQYVNGAGYLSVHLWRDGRRWHVAVYRLVAAVHLPPRPSPKHEIRHLDGVREKSNVENLAWGTHKENCADTIRYTLARTCTYPTDQNIGL